MTTVTARHTGQPGRHRRSVIALIVSAVLLIASVIMAVTGFFGPAPWDSTTTGYGVAGSGGSPWGNGYGGMMGSRSSGQMWGAGSAGMMAGHLWLPGNG